jgi:PAB-dependent poly(A)-specific ribonuclease subunit 3
VVNEEAVVDDVERDKADDSYNDMLESELGGEVENGRLVRLMIKLGFINERAE